MDEYELSLWKRYKEGDDGKAREEIILRYTPLVKQVAGRVGGSMLKNIDFDDLLSYGIIGLLDAVEKFNPYRGNEFSAYARRRIWGAIIDGLRKDDWVPRAARDRVRKVADASVKLEDKLGRDPTDEELAEYLGISVGETRKWLMDSQRVSLLSLDEMFGIDEHKMEGKDILPDEAAVSPYEAVEKEDMERILKEEILNLSERERQVIALYYYEELTMKEVGEVLGVSESRASQLCSRAIMKLRARFAQRLRESFKAEGKVIRK